MKTAEELKAIKAEMEALNEKLTGLTDEELSQVAGGGSRRTDDPEQEECHKCFNFALWYVEEKSTTLEAGVKETLLGKINYVWDRTLSWHLAQPLELMPVVEEIIAILAIYKHQEEWLRLAYDKMNASKPYLEAMRKKDEE